MRLRRLQEDKVAEVERELNQAQLKVETAQATFDTIVSRMASELARFQVRRSSFAIAVFATRHSRLHSCTLMIAFSCRQ